MKRLILGLLFVLLVGCKEGPPPMYKLGDKVTAFNSIDGIVVDIRTWIGTGRKTADYHVLVDGSGALVWFDEENVKHR